MILNKDKTILQNLLLALLPYTKQNLQLVFMPNKFFNELEKSSGLSKTRLRESYNRAIRDKIIIRTEYAMSLSLRGKQVIQPFVAEIIKNNAKLMVIFDVPEDFAGRRQRFRNILKHLNFQQIQLSVWMSDMDHRQILFESIEDIEIQQWVQLYEASEIKR